MKRLQNCSVSICTVVGPGNNAKNAQSMQQLLLPTIMGFSNPPTKTSFQTSVCTLTCLHCLQDLAAAMGIGPEMETEA